MSVVEVREEWRGRGGESGGISDTRVARRFLIRVDNKNDDAFVIVAAGVLPRRNDIHPRNAYLTARRLKLDPKDNSPYWWTAVVDYSSEPEDKEKKEREQNTNPLDRRAKVELDSENQQIPALRATLLDDEGNVAVDDGGSLLEDVPILNSAGDPYDDPLMVDDALWQITFEKNYAELPEWSFEYANVVNEDEVPFRGRTLPAETLKMTKLHQSDLQEEQGVDFYTVKGTIEYNRRGWLLEPLDKGFNYIAEDPVSKKRIMLDDGQWPSSPVLLDGEGAVLYPQSEVNAVFRKYRYYALKPFSVLPLQDR